MAIPRARFAPRQAAASVAAGLLTAALAWGGAAARTGSPGRSGRVESWDVKITVGCRGDYAVEAKDLRTDGRFAFSAVWTGLMRRDDQDIFLMHRAVELPEWRAEERTAAGERVDLLETADFPDRPELRVQYVLRLSGELRLSFLVRGFDVPVAPSPEAFTLVFPASAENEENVAGLAYDSLVIEGSNEVVIDEAAIRRGPWEKEYRWTWRHRTWIQRQDQNVLHSQSHSVVVKVSVTPAEH